MLDLVVVYVCTGEHVMAALLPSPYQHTSAWRPLPQHM